MSDTGRRILWVLAIALLLFYILTQPQHAADAVNAIFAALIAAFQQIIEFLSALGD